MCPGSPLRVVFYAVFALLLFGMLWPPDINATLVSAAGPVASSAPVPSLSQEPLPPPECALLKAINSTRAYCEDTAGIRRWDLVAGKEDARFPRSLRLGYYDRRYYELNLIVETAKGVLFIFSNRVSLVTPQNEVLSANLKTARNRNAVVLADQSVVLVGGRDAKGAGISTVERIVHRDGLLFVTALPDLPGPARASYALVALADNRVMALGGTTSRYIAHSTADTYILDVNTGKWEDGPKMTEPRVGASATLLPDGSVLVAGGWTPAHDWNNSAGSRTVERWHPGRNEFIKSETKLVTNVAMHRTLWAADKTGKQLLLAGGNNAAVQAYDVDTGIWRLVGEFCEGYEKGNRNVATGVADGQHFLIGTFSGNSCIGDRRLSTAWEQIPLRLPGSAQWADLEEKGITLFRSGFAFLPGEGDAPSLVLGGAIHAGMNRYAATAAVDAIWPDGRIEALPALNHARRDASISRTADGSIWLSGGELRENFPHETKEVPKPDVELLPVDIPLEQARWIAGGDIFISTPENRLVYTPGRRDGMNNVIVDVDAVAPGLVKHFRYAKSPFHAIPAPPRERTGKSRYMQNLVERELADGRIIFAGGVILAHRLALLEDDSMQDDAEDEYVEIGGPVSLNTYDIFEPDTRTWRQSAPSRGHGGVVAVLDDGRVASYGEIAKVEQNDDDGETAQREFILEISSVDGNSWNVIAMPDVSLWSSRANLLWSSIANLFTHQGELFVAGEIMHEDALQWFNDGAQRWETLWRADLGTNRQAYLGLIIARQLGNGKRVVPVAGL